MFVYIFGKNHTKPTYLITSIGVKYDQQKIKPPLLPSSHPLIQPHACRGPASGTHFPNKFAP